MRIGTACATGGRGAVPIQDWRADELPSRVDSPFQFVSRAPDADLIDEVRSRTACLDDFVCSSALIGSTLPGLGPTSVPPINTLAVSMNTAYG
jgi:hypothetical protein